MAVSSARWLVGGGVAGRMRVLTGRKAGSLTTAAAATASE